MYWQVTLYLQVTLHIVYNIIPRHVANCMPFELSLLLQLLSNNIMPFYTLCIDNFPLRSVKNKQPDFWPTLRNVFLREAARAITKTRLYNFDPLKPHFYIVKLGFTGYTLFFLFLLKT